MNCLSIVIPNAVRECNDQVTLFREGKEMYGMFTIM